MTRKRKFYEKRLDTPDGYILMYGETDQSVVLRALHRKSRAKKKTQLFSGQLGVISGVRLIDIRNEASKMTEDEKVIRNSIVEVLRREFYLDNSHNFGIVALAIYKALDRAGFKIVRK